jgi:hypothetical protein
VSAGDGDNTYLIACFRARRLALLSYIVKSSPNICDIICSVHIKVCTVVRVPDQPIGSPEDDRERLH